MQSNPSIHAALISYYPNTGDDYEIGNFSKYFGE